MKLAKNKGVFMLDDKFAVCKNGTILFCDDLGEFYHTNYKSILTNINRKTKINDIKESIINLKSIIIDDYEIDFINYKIYLIGGLNVSFTIEYNILYFLGACVDLDFISIVENRYNLDENIIIEIAKVILSAQQGKNINNFVKYDDIKAELFCK